jgi:capsular exopolysaccharide synthesis family protein
MKRVEITCFPALDYAVTEAINALCTNLTFYGRDVKRIMLTSCNSGEGKTFLSMNFARTMAALGKNVAFIDADLRRSGIMALYGLLFEGGLGYGTAHFLAGKCDMDEALYVTNIPGLCMMPVGRTVANPLPLLNSSRFLELLEELSTHFDYVFVDAPPVGLVIDAAEIAKSCDGTLLVVQYNGARRRELMEARMQIERTGCAILGAVLNQVKFDSHSNRYYSKSYLYNKSGARDAGKSPRRPSSGASTGKLSV